MSEKMIPLEGETQKKRVVRCTLFYASAIDKQVANGFLGDSVTFSTQISEVSTMDPGIRTTIFATCS